MSGIVDFFFCLVTVCILHSFAASQKQVSNQNFFLYGMYGDAARKAVIYTVNGSYGSSRQSAGVDVIFTRVYDDIYPGFPLVSLTMRHGYSR